MAKFLRQEDGVTSIIVAVAFILIIAFCGLVIDLGSAYMEQSALQNAADAAAFACGTLLPVPVGDTEKINQVIAAASEYVQKNGFDADCVDAIHLEDAIDGNYYSVHINLRSEVSYSFAPVIGIDGTAISKQAKISLKPVTSTGNAVPLGIEASRYAELLAQNEGQDLIIKYDGGDGDEGFFGALDLDGVQGGGAQDFESWLAFGYDGILSVGDILYIESGNMSGPTTEAFLTRYYQCTHFASEGGCSAEHYDPDCPRVVTIIVYTIYGNNTVQVEGFLPIVLESLNGNGEIVASLITMETNSGDTNGVIGGAGDYGIYRARLVE